MHEQPNSGLESFFMIVSWVSKSTFTNTLKGSKRGRGVRTNAEHYLDQMENVH